MLILLTVAAVAWLAVLAVVAGVCASAAAGDRALEAATASPLPAPGCSGRRHRTRPLRGHRAWAPHPRTVR